MENPEREDAEKALDDLQQEGAESEGTDDEMIEPDADPLDTEVEDADLFIGEGDDEPA